MTTYKLVEAVESMFVTLTKDGVSRSVIDVVLHCQSQGSPEREASPTYRMTPDGAKQLARALIISIRSAEGQPPSLPDDGSSRH